MAIFAAEHIWSTCSIFWIFLYAVACWIHKFSFQLRYLIISSHIASCTTDCIVVILAWWCLNSNYIWNIFLCGALKSIYIALNPTQLPLSFKNISKPLWAWLCTENVTCFHWNIFAVQSKIITQVIYIFMWRKIL